MFILKKKTTRYLCANHTLANTEGNTYLQPWSTLHCLFTVQHSRKKQPDPRGRAVFRESVKKAAIFTQLLAAGVRLSAAAAAAATAPGH